MVNLALQLTNWGGGEEGGEEGGRERGEQRSHIQDIPNKRKKKKRVFLRAAAVAMVTLTPNH